MRQEGEGLKILRKARKQGKEGQRGWPLLWASQCHHCLGPQTQRPSAGPWSQDQAPWGSERGMPELLHGVGEPGGRTLWRIDLANNEILSQISPLCSSSRMEPSSNSCTRSVQEVSSHVLWKTETFIEEDTRNTVRRTMMPQSPAK